MMAMLQRSEELMMAMMENNQRGNYGGKESMMAMMANRQCCKEAMRQRGAC